MSRNWPCLLVGLFDSINSFMLKILKESNETSFKKIKEQSSIVVHTCNSRMSLEDNRFIFSLSTVIN